MDTSKIDEPNEKLIMQEHEGCSFIRLHERNVKRMNKQWIKCSQGQLTTDVFKTWEYGENETL